MLFAYADPPYLRCCRLYGHHHPDGRIGAWVKPFCAFKRGVRPAYAWEPVIYRGGRNPGYGYPHPPPVKGGEQTTPKDYIAEPITLKRGLTGAKPLKVNLWVLALLGFELGDKLDDLYPGTGGMTEAVAIVSG